MEFDERFNEFHRRIAAASGSPLAKALDGLFRDVRLLQNLSVNSPSPEEIQRSTCRSTRRCGRATRRRGRRWPVTSARYTC